MQTLNALFTPTYRNVTSTLEIIDVVTGVRESIKTFDHLIEAPEWTLDSQQIYFNSLGSIYSLHLITGAVSRLDTGFASNCNNDHVISPCQQNIAISHNVHEDGLSRIYQLPLSGGVPVLLTPIGPSYLHSWSPDGKTLAYCAERNGRYDIYVIPSTGGVEKALTSDFGHNDGPEFSPCGRYIYFNSTHSGLMQIWRMDADGANLQQLTRGQANHWFPHISPDGKTLVCIAYSADDVAAHDHPANKHVQLMRMPTEGGEPEVFAELFGGQGTINVNAWAPDSRRLAFVSYALK